MGLLMIWMSTTGARRLMVGYHVLIWRKALEKHYTSVIAMLLALMRGSGDQQGVMRRFSGV